MMGLQARFHPIVLKRESRNILEKPTLLFASVLDNSRSIASIGKAYTVRTPAAYGSITGTLYRQVSVSGVIG